MSLASDRPEFTPPSSPGRGRAISLAIFAHVLLIAALTWGVSWKRESNNAPVQAELWSTTVQQAAPALVEPMPEPKVESKPEPKVEPPPPTPKPVRVVEPEPKIDPQIAIEKAKKEEKKKLEKKKAADAKALAKQEAEEEAEEEARLERLEAAKAKKLADAKSKVKKETAENAKLEAAIKSSRDANMKRIQGIAGASGSETATGTVKQSSGPSAGYGGRVSARVKPNIVFTAEVSGNIEAGVEVRTSPDGTITGRRIIKSSGNKAWDDAVLRALDKTEILPKDTDGRVPSTIEIYFKPKDLL
jgi:colicin import membrane protein